MNGEERRAEHLRWGLIPSWARSASVGSRLINARSETAAELPSFRTAFTRRRCLVLADGFYEWRRVGSSRIPMRIVMKSGEPFAFAGFWDSWRDPEGKMVRSCTIITTEPNNLLRPIHDRMPAILSRDAEPFWLDDGLRDPLALGSLLTPYPDGALEAYRVSPMVNRPSNDGPEVIVPEGEDLPPFRSGQANLKLFQLPPAWSRRLPRVGPPSRLRHPAGPDRGRRCGIRLIHPCSLFAFPETPPPPGLMTAAH